MARVSRCCSSRCGSLSRLSRRSWSGMVFVTLSTTLCPVGPHHVGPRADGTSFVPSVPQSRSHWSRHRASGPIERGRARSQRCPRSGQVRSRGLIRGLSANPTTSRAGQGTASGWPPCDIQPCVAFPELVAGASLARTHALIDGNCSTQALIDGNCRPNDICATSFIAGLITDVLDDFQFSEESIQNVGSSEHAVQDGESSDEDVEGKVCDVQFVIDALEPTIAESDEELDDSWAAASFFTEEAVRCATPFSPAQSVDSITSMAANIEGLDDDGNEDVYMVMDDEHLLDDLEMEAATYMHMALRFARVAVAAGIEEIRVAVVEEKELAWPAGNESVIEAFEDSAFSLAVHRHDDDACSVHSADSDEEHATNESSKVGNTPGMKMLTSGMSEEQEAETLRARAHNVFRQASSDGCLYSAFRQMRNSQMKSVKLPQPSGSPTSLGPAREVYELRAENSKVLEPLDLEGPVKLAELPQTHEPMEYRDAKVREAPKHADVHAKSRPSTSTPKSSEAIAPTTAVRPASSPASRKQKHKVSSHAEPVEAVIRSLHTSRSRRNVIGGVVRKQMPSYEGLCENQQTCAAPSRHSASDVRRHRSKHRDLASSFRLDSPAGNKHDREMRESSLTRAYEALGAEVHCLDDAEEADFYGSSSGYVGRAPVTGSLNNSHSSRRTSAVGLGQAPFAAAMDLPDGLHGAPLSAMGLDLGEDAKATVLSTTSRKPMLSSQPRPSSLCALRVSKPKESQGRLPSLPTSKSTGLLPSLAAKPWHSKHRSQDPLAWSTCDLSSSKSRWGSMRMGSVF